MREKYDVVVVGAGPAGSTAAKVASEGGAKVLLLEKDREVGIPVRCGEAGGEEGIKKVIERRDEWISNRIEAVRLVAPDGNIVRLYHKDVGYILDRKRFDYDLAKLAAEAGADVVTKAYVYDLLKKDGVINGVKVKHLGKNYTIKAKLVIGADGIESRVGRWAGLKTHLKLNDIEPCVQMTVTNIKLERQFCDFYFSTDVAPGGYLWVFPKNENSANIGLGITGEYSQHKSPLAFLKEFMNKNFPNASVLTTVAGGVACSPYMKDIVKDGLMLGGDAAHQTNPISGGGSVLGMIAAQIAGRVAAESVKEDNVSQERLEKYVQEWDKTGGFNHRRAYRLKEAVHKLTNEVLNKTAAKINKKTEDKRTVINVFKTVLVHQPKLIPDVIKVFMG